MDTGQEEAAQETEWRRGQEEIRRFKEQQSQVLAEKEERAPETERRKKQEETAEEREQHDEGKSGKGLERKR